MTNKTFKVWQQQTAPGIIVTPETRTFALFTALFAVCLILARRAFNRGLYGLEMARIWLNTRHNFTDDEDPVILTGWQYIGVAVVCCAVCLALSIKID